MTEKELYERLVEMEQKLVAFIENSRQEREERTALMKRLEEKMDRIDAFVEDARTAVEKMSANPMVKNVFGRFGL